MNANPNVTIDENEGKQMKGRMHQNKRIPSYYRTQFVKIGSLTPVFFPPFFPENSLKIRDFGEKTKKRPLIHCGSAVFSNIGGRGDSSPTLRSKSR